MGLIYIVLSAACSLAIAHFLKYSGVHGYDVLKVLTINYLVAFGTAIGYSLFTGADPVPDFPLWFWIFAVFIGILFITNFFVFGKSVDVNGVGVSVAAMRISLLVPVLLSMIFYREEITVLKIAGIFLVFAALVVLVISRRDVHITAVGSQTLLLLLFLFSGIADGSMKIFEEEMQHAASEYQFMSVVFLSALLAGLSATAGKRQLSFSRGEIVLGILVGLPNLFTSVFLIRAFAYMDGSIAYSMVNILIVAGGALIGRFIWKDQISVLQWTGIMLAIMAIAVLIHG
jgi:drug/metabolite transporter (DMT)-like permease